MLHGHIEALFNHAVLHVHVAAGAYHRLGAARMVETRLPLLLKPLLARIEHDRILQVLVAWLAERARSTLESLSLITVLTRARNLELKTLAVENLVEVEPRRSGVEANSLASG